MVVLVVDDLLLLRVLGGTAGDEFADAHWDAIGVRFRRNRSPTRSACPLFRVATLAWFCAPTLDGRPHRWTLPGRYRVF